MQQCHNGALDSSLDQVEVKAQDTFPKKECLLEDPSLSNPFALLSGESLQFLGRTSEGLIGISDYRVLVKPQEYSYYSIPLGDIESIECRDIVSLYIFCKDAKLYKCTFTYGEQCSEVQKHLNKALSPPERIEDMFALAFYSWVLEEMSELHQQLVDDADDIPREEKVFVDEFQRLGFESHLWRVSSANENFQLCSSYPRKLIVPSCISDSNLAAVAKFRSVQRIPVIVWRHSNGAVLARCSQPEVGWLGWRATEDEELIKAIAEACAESSAKSIKDDLGTQADGQDENSFSLGASDLSSCEVTESRSHSETKKVIIIDARSYTTAFANRVRGGGCECPDYYPGCEIQFMNLANIHVIRKSHNALRHLLASSPDIPNWLSLLENTRWLSHISGLLKAAETVCRAMQDEHPVLVHCSDGWDRTPQITSMAELCMDPFYRTFEGFQILVEREWLDFGHKFSDRCGVGLGTEDINERSPIFLQWLDCVYQLLLQYPTEFQFNQAYLSKLAQHIYSNLFGTFLSNSMKERNAFRISERTYSVWLYLRMQSRSYTNYLYHQTTQILYPSCHVKDLRVWTTVYTSENPVLSTVPNDESNFATNSTCSEEDVGSTTASGGTLIKTKSCDDLHNALSAFSHARRLSDPNLHESCQSLSVLSPAAENNIDPDSESGPQERRNRSDDTAAGSGEVVCSGGSLGIQNGPEIRESGVGDEAEHECVETAVEALEEDYNPSGRKLLKAFSRSSIEGSTDTLVAELGVIEPLKSDDESASNRSDKEQNRNTDKEKTPDKVLCNGAKDVVIGNKRPHKFTKCVSAELVDDRRIVFGGCCYCCSTKRVLEELADVKNSIINCHLNGNHQVSLLANCTTKENSSGSIPPSLSCTVPPAFEESLSATALPSFDGLSNMQDEVSKRVYFIKQTSQNEIDALKRELQSHRQALSSYLMGHIRCHHYHHDAHGEDEMSLPESVGSGSGGSMGHESGVSDTSWEAVEDSDGKPTLWVPDHAVDSCFQCQMPFWIGRRRHHCRNCGKIFCADCSENSIPVPKEQLYHPVRVCGDCYTHIGHDYKPKMITAASN